MTNQQAYNEQFWRTVERVSAQVAQARNEGPTTRKSVSSTASRGNRPENGSAAVRDGLQTRSRPGAATARPALAREPAEPAMGADTWIGAAVSLVEPVAGALMDAIEQGEVEPSAGEDKLARAVSAVVTPVLIDTIGDQPEAFDFGPPGEDGADGASPWDSIARVVAASVSSIVAETKTEEPVEPADPQTEAAGGEKILPVLATLAAPVVWHAIDHWRKRRRRKDLAPGGAPDDLGGGDDGIASAAAAQIAGEVVQAVVGVLAGGKLFAPRSLRPPYLPGPVTLPAVTNRRANRRYYAAV